MRNNATRGVKVKVLIYSIGSYNCDGLDGKNIVNVFPLFKDIYIPYKM